jgi:hypothetical protein
LEREPDLSEIRKGHFDARDRLYGMELEGKTLGVAGMSPGKR